MGDDQVQVKFECKEVDHLWPVKKVRVTFHTGRAVQSALQSVVFVLPEFVLSAQFACFH